MCSDEPVLVAEGLGKCYQSFRRPLDRLRQVLFGKRRSFHSAEFWALRNVSFALGRGQALGLIGRNGSGKSTLLQILAGTLPPSTGRAEIAGRIGALLELGSGFDPEFTGRENVRLQGSILGFADDEIEARIGEIEAFAEIGAFFDQPVRTYSSGMFVRLAFAVQVMLVPEVLIVDEALAVGDAPFQIKCMAHMRKLLASGISIILASHDMEAVRGLCSQVLWIHAGEVRMLGDPHEVTTAYLRFLFGGDAAGSEPEPTIEPLRPTAGADERSACEALQDFTARDDLERWGSGALRIVAAQIAAAARPHIGPAVHRYHNGERLRLVVEIAANTAHDGTALGVAFSIRNVKALNVLTATTHDAGLRLPALPAGGVLRVAFEFDNVLARGEYGVVVAVEELVGDERRYLDFVENAFLIEVLDERPPYAVVSLPVHVEVSADTTQLEGR